MFGIVSPWLNSHYQTGLKNLLDTAVLDGVELDDACGLAERWQKVDDVPFDFERRRMSVVVKGDDAAHQLILSLIHISSANRERR